MTYTDAIAAPTTNRLHAYIQRNPSILLRLLIILGLASIIMIVSLMSYGLHRDAHSKITTHIEDDAIRISSVLVKQYQHLLFDNSGAIEIISDQLPILDERIRSFLQPFGIVKVKIFNADGIIVYSTDKSIINKRVTNNKRLLMALSGDINSRLGNEEKMIDLDDEEVIDIDVVETYIPLYDENNRITGSIETYIDVTRYHDDIDSQIDTVVILLSVVLILVFCLSTYLVYLGTSQLQQALNQLNLLATTDPLTGAYNRRAVLQRAEEEISKMQRHHDTPSPTCLGAILMDIDNFKMINDTHGHDAGDTVLCEVARRTIDCLREYDIFGRFGGEEFLIFIPGEKHQSIMQAAERIRESLAETPIQYNDKRLSITSSFGVAYCDSPYDISTTIQNADDALYQAKVQGRNRVVGYT